MAKISFGSPWAALAGGLGQGALEGAEMAETRAERARTRKQQEMTQALQLLGLAIKAEEAQPGMGQQIMGLLPGMGGGAQGVPQALWGGFDPAKGAERKAQRTETELMEFFKRNNIDPKSPTAQQYRTQAFGFKEPETHTMLPDPLDTTKMVPAGKDYKDRIALARLLKPPKGGGGSGGGEGKFWRGKDVTAGINIATNIEHLSQQERKLRQLVNANSSKPLTTQIAYDPRNPNAKESLGNIVHQLRGIQSQRHQQELMLNAVAKQVGRAPEWFRAQGKVGGRVDVGGESGDSMTQQLPGVSQAQRDDDAFFNSYMTGQE